MPGAGHDLHADAKHMPVTSCGIQVSTAICRRSFIDFVHRDRSDKHAITLKQRKIGSYDQAGALQHFADRVAIFFSEQPREYGARFRVNSHRAPRS